MNAYYLSIIVLTLVGFCALAYLLLAPIWRFLDREKKASDQWTKEALARRRHQQENGHGSGAPEDQHRPPGNDSPSPSDDTPPAGEPDTDAPAAPPSPGEPAKP